MIKYPKKIEEIWIEKEVENLKFSRSVALVYPNEYKVASSNLGFHNIFKNLTKFGSKPVRFFFDNKSQSFFSFDTDRKLNEFENIFLSISFENDYENLIIGFNKLFKKLPAENHRIIAGGAAVSLSPFLFSNLANEIAIGESEFYFDGIDRIENLIFIESSVVNQFFNDYFQNTSFPDKSDAENGVRNIKDNIEYKIIEKEDFNKKLILFKNLYNKETKLKEPSFSSFISIYSSFKNYFLVEISRGCPFKCQFCSLASLYDNYRVFDIDSIIKKLHTGYVKTKSIGLISAVVPPLYYIKKIKENFDNITLHFSSLRLDSLDNEFIEIAWSLKLKTITIAIETAIEQLRFSIGKKFKNNQIFDFIIETIKIGIVRFKLYFILGLKAMSPQYIYSQKEVTLSEEIDSIVDLIDNIQSTAFEKTGRLPLISISINPLIPRPMTPLWNYDFMDFNLYKKAKELLKRQLLKKKNIIIEFISYNEAKKEYLYCWNIVEK